MYIKTIAESESWNEAADVKATAEDVVVAQFKERYRIPRFKTIIHVSTGLDPLFK